MKKNLLVATFLSSMILVATSANADSTKKESNITKNSGSTFDNISDAFKNGRAYIDARYRFETVDIDGFADEANASTLRTRMGFETAAWNNFKILVEGENTSEIGGDDYNSTTNGNVGFPVVADPTGTELNQAWLSFTGIKDTTIKYGRQRIVLDNVRYIGDVGWRQNNQTFDSVSVVNTSIADTTFIYAYVYNVNRIVGDDHPLGDLNTQTHVFNASYSGLPIGKLTAYTYLLDVDNLAAVSSSTYGASLVGKQAINDDVNFIYRAEYARQSDYGNNPTSYDVDYWHLQPGISFKNLTVKAGWEVLGSDNSIAAFSTPLATLHAQNGWADQFLSTPAAGLEDIYGLVSYKIDNLYKCLDGTKLTLVYHDFSADDGGADYGTEWNFNITKTFHENYTVGVKYANYNADSFSSDTEKLIFTLGVKFSQ